MKGACCHNGQGMLDQIGGNARVAASTDDGAKVERFEIDREGRATFYIAGREPKAIDELDRELEEFEARHGQG